MGGYRTVQVWLEKPSFDARAFALDQEFFCLTTQKYLESVHHENGWVSNRAGSTYAKPFLKQCPVLFDKVWEQIARSCHPIDSPENFGWTDEEYRQLLDDPWWESKCKITRKRFLLEVDIVTKETVLVMPRVYDGDRDWTPTDYSIEPLDAICSQLLGEYDSKPFHWRLANPYKDRDDVITRCDRIF